MGLETPKASLVIHPDSLLLILEGFPHLALLVCTVGLFLLIGPLSVLWMTHTLWIMLSFLYFQCHTWVTFRSFSSQASFAFLCFHVCPRSRAFLHPKFVFLKLVCVNFILFLVFFCYFSLVKGFFFFKLKYSLTKTLFLLPCFIATTSLPFHVLFCSQYLFLIKGKHISLLSWFGAWREVRFFHTLCLECPFWLCLESYYSAFRSSSDVISCVRPLRLKLTPLSLFFSILRDLT